MHGRSRVTGGEGGGLKLCRIPVRRGGGVHIQLFAFVINKHNVFRIQSVGDVTPRKLATGSPVAVSQQSAVQQHFILFHCIRMPRDVLKQKRADRTHTPDVRSSSGPASLPPGQHCCPQVNR